jgi:pimeloyl-ACP methyl ester carboxylesterase
MKNILYIICSLFVIVSCKKVNLDGLAFPSQKTDAYLFEDYETDVVISESYKIPEDKIHLFPLTSTDSETGETYQIYAVYIGDMSTITADSVILYAHGQSHNMDIYWDRAKLLANIGSKNNYGVLMMDYRGYGMSEGESSEQGLYDDVETCINWLDDQGVNETSTIYYGFSLGCIPVIHHAAYKTNFVPSKLIIESPLASVENLAQSSTLINVDPKFISTLVFNNAEKIKDVTTPLLWFHGIEDDYIEISNGQLIFDNYNGEYKEDHKIPDCGHSDIPDKIGYESYIEILEAFIKK